MVLGSKIRALHLWSRYSTTWAVPPILFCSGYFWDRVLCYTWASLDSDPPPVYASCSWNGQVFTVMPVFSVGMGFHKLALPGLDWNCDPPDLSLCGVWVCTTTPSYWLRWSLSSQTLYPGWPQTTILPISASWVAVIISLGHLAMFYVI
jgi:hypothetical protein